jgi:glycine/D-amino acid oxidase-like deaminating enzyme
MSASDFRIARRRFLRGMAAAATAAAASAPPVRAFAMRRRDLRVGVVGCGILGASIAMHLAEAGAQVLLFEKREPAAGATRNSFAWLNAYVDDDRYRRLRLASMAAYHRLDSLLGLKIRWGGYLNWSADAAGSRIVAANAAQMQPTPYPVHTLSGAELAALYPMLRTGPVDAAFWSSIDGHLDPVHATRCFLARAQRLGARVLMPCAIERLHLAGGRLKGVTTDRGSHALDHIVIAAGVDAPALLAPTGFRLPLRHAPGILAHSQPGAPVLGAVCDAPGGVSFKQMADGRIVGTDAPEPPELPVHSGILDHPMDFPDDAIRAMHGQRILGRIDTFLPAAGAQPLDFLTLGFRPLPADGFPAVGPVPGARGVYVAVTHSGVTLAPHLGELIAAEVVDGSTEGELAPYRPQRFHV